MGQRACRRPLLLLVRASDWGGQRSSQLLLPVSRTDVKWEPYQNLISNDDWSCRSSEEQIPQIVENNKNRVEIWEPKEAYYSLHTQEVRGSSPCAPTIIQ